jgi:hypothetical protein
MVSVFALERAIIGSRIRALSYGEVGPVAVVDVVPAEPLTEPRWAVNAHRSVPPIGNADAMRTSLLIPVTVTGNHPAPFALRLS